MIAPFRTVLCAAFLALAVLPFPAGATVTVTPMAVLIEGRERYADVNLINTSEREESYEIGWLFYRMEEETGSYEIIDSAPGDFDLTQNLVFSPRRVTLQPGATQKVRLALRLKGEPPEPGDYRAHLEMKQVSPPEIPHTVDLSGPGATEKPKIQVGIAVSVGFSIPVVYRVGESDATAVMGDITTHIHPKTGKIAARVPIAREGNVYGLMGNLSVYHTPRGGSETLVGEIKNANIFPEINRRVFDVTLNTSTLGQGSLRVVYQHFDKTENMVFAEREIVIGQ